MGEFNKNFGQPENNTNGELSLETDVLILETGKPTATTLREAFGTNETLVRNFITIMEANGMPGATDLLIFRGELPQKPHKSLGFLGLAHLPIRRVEHKKGYLIGTDELWAHHLDSTFTIKKRIYLCEDEMLRITAPDVAKDQKLNFKNFTGRDIHTGIEVPYQKMIGDQSKYFESWDKPITFKLTPIDQVIQHHLELAQ